MTEQKKYPTGSKVTDLNYYLDRNLVQYCDLAIKRRAKKWDNLWIYDG